MNKFNNPLDNVKVASPCSADWNEMIGDARKRFCGECKLNVYNLSEMSKVDAEQLLIQSEGRVCVRFYQRADGTVLTQDCPVGWQAVKNRVSKVSAAVASLVIGLFGSLGFTFAYNRMTESNYERTIGAVAYPTPKRKPTPKTTPPPEVTMGAIAMPTPKNTPKPNKNDDVKMGEIAISRD